MVDVILVILALATVAALVALRRKPTGSAPAPARPSLPGAAGQPQAPGGRLAAALAAAPQRPAQARQPSPVLAAASYGPAPAAAAPAPPPLAFTPLPGACPTALLSREQQGCLEVASGEEAGQRFPLSPGDNRIGRGPGNHLRLADRTVSNQHAILRLSPGQALLFDDSSTNGTFVNGQRVLQPRPLADGDRITVGQTVLVIHFGAAEGHAGILS